MRAHGGSLHVRLRPLKPGYCLVTISLHPLISLREVAHVQLIRACLKALSRHGRSSNNSDNGAAGKRSMAEGHPRKAGHAHTLVSYVYLMTPCSRSFNAGLWRQNGLPRDPKSVKPKASESSECVVM